MVSIEAFRSYCRISADEGPDEICQLCLDAAVAYMANAGVPSPEDDDHLYDLACYMLAESWYDARGSESYGVVPHQYARAVQQIILQLRV